MIDFEIGGTINLRTLTLKSRMGFGKWEDLTVQQVFDMGNISYLLWCYYACSKINFNQEILDKLQLTQEWLINKPGVHPDPEERKSEAYTHYYEFVKKGMTENTYMGHISHLRKRKRDGVKRSRFNKMVVQDINRSTNRDSINTTK